MTSYAETQRLPRANLSDFSAAQTEIWDHVIETRKLDFMPNMFAVMGQSPEALRAVAAVGEHVRWHSALDNDLREMVICTVAQAVGNIYEWDHHIHKVPERFRKAVGTLSIEAEPAPVGPALRLCRLLASGAGCRRRAGRWVTASRAGGCGPRRSRGDGRLLPAARQFLRRARHRG